jgi:hypothetical protein
MNCISMCMSSCRRSSDTVRPSINNRVQSSVKIRVHDDDPNYKRIQNVNTSGTTKLQGKINVYQQKVHFA